jgi:FkbM family methyltransferase
MVPFNTLVATRYGHAIVHAHDLYVGQSLQLYGEFSPGEMDLYRFLLEPGDVVLEGGANIGALTVPIAQHVGDEGRVFAYEPQRLTYQALCGNLALNSLVNVVAFNLALGAKEGTIYVPPVNLTAMDNVGGVELSTTHAPNATVGTIDAIRLPTLDLLKLDIEGMEYDALQGAEETVTRCRPLIVAEIDRDDKKPLVLTWLRDHGYRLYAHNPPLYRADNWRGIDVNAWPGVVSINVLAVPHEIKPYEAVTLAHFALELIPDDTPQQEAA